MGGAEPPGWPEGVEGAIPPPPPPRWSGLRLLRERSYRLLWTGLTVSTFGDRFANIALPFAILAAGHGVGGIGVVLAARSIPALVFLLVSGVVADRAPRRIVMLSSDAARAVLHLSLAVLLAAGAASVLAFAILEALFGAADAFFEPATTGLVPELVAKDSLQQANGFLSLSRSAVGVAGPAVAGLVVVTAGPAWAFAIDGASFAVSGLCLALLRVPARAPGREHGSFVGDLLAGWRYVASQRWLWFTIATFGVNNIFFTPLFVLGPVVALDDWGGAKTWGLIAAAGSVGAIVGGLVAVRWRARRPLLVSYVISLLMAPPLLLLARPFAPGIVAVGQALAMGVVALSNTLWFTVLQRHVPEDRISRTSAVDYFGSFILNPIAFAIVGPVSGALGISTTLFVSGIALLVLPIVQLVIVPEVRRM